MSTRRRRKEELGRLLMEPDRLPLAGMLEDLRANVREPAGVEFEEHMCWTTLFVWPDEVDPSLPGRIECAGCGMVGRFELEARP